MAVDYEKMSAAEIKTYRKELYNNYKAERKAQRDRERAARAVQSQERKAAREQYRQERDAARAQYKTARDAARSAYTRERDALRANRDSMDRAEYRAQLNAARNQYQTARNEARDAWRSGSSAARGTYTAARTQATQKMRQVYDTGRAALNEIKLDYNESGLRYEYANRMERGETEAQQTGQPFERVSYESFVTSYLDELRTAHDTKEAARAETIRAEGGTYEPREFKSPYLDVFNRYQQTGSWSSVPAQPATQTPATNNSAAPIVGGEVVDAGQPATTAPPLTSTAPATSTTSTLPAASTAPTTPTTPTTPTMPTLPSTPAADSTLPNFSTPVSQPQQPFAPPTAPEAPTAPTVPTTAPTSNWLNPLNQNTQPGLIANASSLNYLPPLSVPAAPNAPGLINYSNPQLTTMQAPRVNLPTLR